MESADGSQGGEPGIERAYVSADSGIAAGVDGGSTAPDQIYVEFSDAVVVEDADGRAVPADGFALDGTIAGIETVQQAAVAGSPEGMGSRVLVLTLSTGIAANEHPTLSYRPESGNVRTPSGSVPAAFSDLDVEPGSPRVLDVSVPGDRGDAVRVQFDRPVVTRTEDATMFSLTDDNGNDLLDGDIAVQGPRVTLPLTRDIVDMLSSSDEAVSLQYREGGSDTERMHNLAGESDTLVQRFSQEITFEVAPGGFEILEASVPRSRNGSGNIDRTRIELWFAPSVTADSAAGYELRNTLATVTGAVDTDSDNPNSPDVTLDLDSPIDPEDEGDATVHYDPERGDTIAASNEAPTEPLSASVEALAAPPSALNARLGPDGESISLSFDRSVRSQFGDATGFTLSGAGGVSLSGVIRDSDDLKLSLTDPLDLDDTSNTVMLSYTTQGNNGPKYNIVGASDGMPVDAFKLAVDRSNDAPEVEQVRLPQDQRDRVVVRFDRPVEAENTVGFSLDGAVSRVERLAKVDGMDDELVPRTVVLGLHVDVSSAAATLSYDAEEGTVESRDGGAPASFEADVEMLPPAPTLERAVARSGEAAIRVEYDREVMLNRGTAAGFDVSYEQDRDDLPRLTGDASVEGSTVVLGMDDPVALIAEPTLHYEPDDEGANVLGTEEGVRAEATSEMVVEAESGGDGGYDDGTDEAGNGGSAGPAPTLVGAEIPDDAPDRVVCTFDTAVDADTGTLTVEGADLTIESVVDTGGEAELTLELTRPVPAGATLNVIYESP
ncbi:hypothetical protein [Halolamina litorea]|uniref:Uncharacterized protein n=1 Tax=Halolamina litorea TaxID=1515593 RepID=A0ABD6BNZ0_9EURY|nr:hypothetical protein [Halolamina litorea]